MGSERSRKEAIVRRITVDERLAEDIVRLTVCRLKDEVEVFFDRQGDWGPEREVWARPKDYARKLGVSPADAPLWESLEEGQLFVSGGFEIIGDRAAPDHFQISPGAKEFIRIDDLEEFKEGVKHLYSRILTGGQVNGQPH